MKGNLIPLFLGLLLAVAMPAPQVSAQSGDPSDTFLQAYMASQQAEKLEREGKLKDALAKFRYAASMLEQVKADTPNWQPLIVDFRLRKISDSLRNLEQKMATQAAVEDSIADPPPVPDYSRPSGSPAAPAPDLLTETEVLAIENLGSADELPSNPSPPDRVPGPSTGGPSVIVGDSGIQARALQQKVQALESDLNRTRVELDQLQKERDSLRSQVKETSNSGEADAELQAQLDKLKTENTALSEKVAAAEAGLKESATREKELATKLEDATDESTKIREEMEKKLADAATQVEALSKERDTALGKLTETEELAAQAATLQTENEQLLLRLQTADQRIAELTKEPDRLREQLNEARSELTALRVELDSARAAGQRGEEQITQLQEELQKLNGQLAEARAVAENPEELKRIQGENDLLRQIVLRQLKEQARRDQARRLVMEEMEKTEGRSDLLVQQIGILSEPIIQLTDQERDLFRKPKVELQAEEVDHVAQQIVQGGPVDLPNLGTPTPMEASPPTEVPMETPVVSEVALVTEMETSVPAEEMLSEENPETVAAISAELSMAKPSESETSLPGEVAATDPITDGLPTEPVDISSAAPSTGPRVETTSTPKVPEELLPVAREARDHFERGQYRQAELAYQKILSRAPDNVYALSNLGVVLFRSGKLKQAEITLKKAIAASSDDAFSHATLGIVYYNMGKYDDAVEALTKSITLDSKNAQAHNYLGITASQKGWREAAEEEFQKAIALNPDYADAHFNLAVVYATDDPPSSELAKRHYQRAITLGAEPDPMMEELMN